jgi:hypothetical protein
MERSSMPLAEDDPGQGAERAAQAAARRRRLTQAAVFGGTVVAALAVATPAMAWPMMGC